MPPRIFAADLSVSPRPPRYHNLDCNEYALISIASDIFLASDNSRGIDRMKLSQSVGAGHALGR